ncbi:conserved protein of unknown function [Tenacibaculum sp. 190130A14a]|uniref:hypothetical protein n=1 Tax=Tenacibaculum polynesiense TaxID=3137857 RepID=UPI0032B28B29
MKNQILNFGKALNNAEQKKVNGGKFEMSCAEANWTPYTCELAQQNPPMYDTMYRKCC